MGVIEGCSLIGSIVLQRNPVITIGKNIERSFARGQWSNYRHEIRAMGGYWSCHFTISGTVEELRYLLRAGLGAHVQTFSIDGIKAWEGFVNSFTLNFYDTRLRYSLDSMANRSWARYLSVAGSEDVGATAQDYDAEQVARLEVELSGGGSFSRSTKQNETDSQAKYGIKEHVLSGGVLGSAVADDLAQNYINNYAFPRPTIEFAGQNTDPRIATLEFECLGYFHTLYWRRYNQTASAGNENASVQIDAVITDVGQFINSTDVTTNTLQVPKEHDIDRKAADIILDVTRLGDSSNNRFLVGVYDDRKLIYEQQGDTTGSVDYHRRLNNKTIFNQGQVPMLPTAVRPNKWLRVEGVFPFRVSDYSDLRNDPSVVFVEAVRYDETRGLELIGARNNLIDMMLARAAMANVSNL